MNMQKCSAICKTGKQCLRNAGDGGNLCAFHSAAKTANITDITAINDAKPIGDDNGDDENKATTKKTDKLTCIAICSNGKKCVRKCCAGFEYCGTHKPVIGTSTQLPLTSAHTIFVEDIDGIAYYLDTYGNIFKAEDVLRQSLTPKVIGQYIRRSDGRCIFAA
jgi:hypothetical protein